MSGRQTTVIRYGALVGPLTTDAAAAQFQQRAEAQGYTVALVAIKTEATSSTDPRTTARGGSAQTQDHDSNRA